MKINKAQIFLVVPRLIEQPTWGGDYILDFKNWAGKPSFSKLKIGQSYELFSGTSLRADINSTDDPAFVGELGHAMHQEAVTYQGDRRKLIRLADLLQANQAEVLGKSAMKLASQIVLIKFTQAKGNSFQLHKREDIPDGKWLSKAESWYYFEPGLLTLGLKKGAKASDYKQVCLAIDREMKKLSEQVKNKEISLAQAKKIAQDVKTKFDPWQFVNLIEAQRDDLIDLSQGSLHHSWEDDDKYPLGNIVYELCYDVMDQVSSIRSFDKCNIRDDGSLRKLDIEDYFRFLDEAEDFNDPETHRVKPKIVFDRDNVRIESLLRTKNYAMDKIMLNDKYQGNHADCRESYHHLFVKTGKVVVSSAANEVQVTKGHSCFVPAAVGNYEVRAEKESEVLKTFIK